MTVSYTHLDVYKRQIHDISVLIYRDTAVRIAVVGKSHIGSDLLHELLQHLDMGRTTFCIDIQAVGTVADHMSLRSQSVEHVLGNGRSAAVGTV